MHRLSVALRCLLLALPILLAASCSDNPRGAEAMAKAQQVIKANPDSALAILRSVSSEADDFSRSQRMAYYLLLADAKNKAYADMSADSIMHEVADYYDTWGDSNEKMRANYLLGCVYRDQGYSPIALKYYNDAVSHVDTSASNCDYAMLASLYGQMGHVYRMQTSPIHELEAGKQAVRFALKAGDTLTALNHSARICLTYKSLGHLDSVLIVSDKIIKAYKAHGRPAEAAMQTGPIMEVYAERNEFDKLPPLIEIYEKQTGLFDKSGNIAKGFEIFYDMKARYYESINKLDSAELYYKKMLDTKFYNCIEAAYKGLISIAMKRGDFKTASEYSVRYCKAKDSHALQRSSTEINRMHSIYKYEAIQRKMTETEAQNYKIKLMLVILCFIIILALYIAYALYKRMKHRSLQVKLENAQKYNSIIEKLNQSQQDYETLMCDNQNYINQKEREIDNLKLQLRDYGHEVSLEKWDIERNLYTSVIVQHLHKIAQRGESITQKETKELMEYVAEIIPLFVAEIKSKSDALSETEYLVCILCRLRFIPSEIAILLDMSAQRITNIRQAINIKLFNDKSAKTLNRNLIALDK